MARQLQFSDELTICNIGETANELLNALQAGENVLIDLSGVERIDTAAIQVLLATEKEAELNRINLTITVSDAVRDYAALIGVSF